MIRAWAGTAPPHELLRPKTLRDWLRVARRGVPLSVWVFGGLAVHLTVRMVEQPLHGPRRPWTPHITQTVCRGAFVLMGMRYRTIGAPIEGPGAVVSNHASWLDIFALNARKRIYFVAKREVQGWPGIGWLARATGTVFIRRDRREAKEQVEVFRERLRLGHKLLFFPEGTSTDGLRVLPFKPTLFAALDDASLRDLRVQPVTLAYHAPDGRDPRFYGWYADMAFTAHLLAVLTEPNPGGVTVRYHAPVTLSEHGNRKALAAALESAVRGGLPRHRGAELPQGERGGLVTPDFLADAEEIGMGGEAAHQIQR